MAPLRASPAAPSVCYTRSSRDWEPDGPSYRQRRSTPARRARAAVAGRAHGFARRHRLSGDRPPLRARRVPAPPVASLLVPVVRRRHGHGLAFVRHHDQRHRRLEARAGAAAGRARHLRLRRTRQTFAQDAGRAFRARRPRRPRRAGVDAREPPRRQGRQRRRAGRLRSLPAWLLRHRRRPLDRRAAGHERRQAAGAPLPLAFGRRAELRRGAAQRHRRAGAGQHRQPHRQAGGTVARRAARFAGEPRPRSHCRSSTRR